MPIHWDVSGQPDNFAGKTYALSIIPCIALLETGLFALISRIEPRKRNLRLSTKAYTAIWMGTLLILFVAQMSIVFAGMGKKLDVSTIIPFAVGLLFIFIGNYLGKMRSNFFAGIRTPWTLSSDLSWSRTHRLAGKLFMLIGAISILSLLVPDRMVYVIVLIAEIAAAVLISMVYSYLVWRVDPNKSSEGRVEKPDVKESSVFGGMEFASYVIVILIAIFVVVLMRSSMTQSDLVPKAESLVTAMAEGDYEGAGKDFDAVMSNGLPPEKLKEVWDQTISVTGGFKGTKGTRSENILVYKTIYVTCEFENMTMDVKVVFGRSGKVCGLWLVPSRE